MGINKGRISMSDNLWFETLEQVKQKYKIKKIENGYWEILK